MPQNQTLSSSQTHLQEHIDVIAKHEQEFLAQRSNTEKLGDRMAGFIGSLPFVVLHIVLLLIWAGWNLAPGHTLPQFDPPPFAFLDLVLCFEAILVASFIVMRQARLSRRSEEREHLMLQILLLTEREITATLGMQRQIAERMGLEQVAKDREITQLSQQTSIDEVASIIKESLPTE